MKFKSLSILVFLFSLFVLPTLASSDSRNMGEVTAFELVPENIEDIAVSNFFNGSYDFSVNGLRAQINKLDFLTEEVLPKVARDAGVEGSRIEDDSILMEGEYEAWPFCFYDWSVVTVGMQMWPRVGQAEIEIKFRDDNKIHLSYESPSAFFRTDLHFEAVSRRGRCALRDADFIAEGTGLNASLRFSFDLDNTGHLEVTSVEIPSYRYDEEDRSEISVCDWFDMLLFVPSNQEKWRVAGDEQFGETMFETMNTMLAHTLDFEGRIEEPLPLSFEGSLDQLETDEGKLIADISLDVDVEQGEDPCAAGLEAMTEPLSKGGDDSIPSWGDMTIELPFWTLSQMISNVGRSGLLCQEHSLNAGFAIIELSILPDGLLKVEEAPSNSGSLLKISLPLKGAVYGAEVHFDLELLAGVVMNCSSGINLQINRATVQNLSGDIGLNGFTVDIVQYQYLVNDAVASYFSQNSILPIAPKVLSLEELGPWGVTVSELGTNSGSLYVGMDFVDDDYCDTDNNPRGTTSLSDLLENGGVASRWPAGEDCSNGIDDNNNGLVDCIDPACFGAPNCTSDEICFNLFDDDLDGLADCDDPDCESNPICILLNSEDCDNGVDDDNDGLIDCDDIIQCGLDEACEGGGALSDCIDDPQACMDRAILCVSEPATCTDDTITVINCLQDPSSCDSDELAELCEGSPAFLQPHWYRDVDGDGYGIEADVLILCEQPEGYVESKRDCNDSDASIHPGAEEICFDGVDTNCNGFPNNDPDNPRGDDPFICAAPNSSLTSLNDEGGGGSCSLSRSSFLQSGISANMLLLIFSISWGLMFSVRQYCHSEQLRRI